MSRHDAITIVLPAGKSFVLQSPNGLEGAVTDLQWWSAQVQTLNGNLGYIDPTHLVLYLTKDVLLSFGHPLNCCATGFHSAANSQHGNGNQPVQTWAWASGRPVQRKNRRVADRRHGWTATCA